jgi:hypothetical protein
VKYNSFRLASSLVLTILGRALGNGRGEAETWYGANLLFSWLWHDDCLLCRGKSLVPWCGQALSLAEARYDGFEKSKRRDRID